MEFQKIEDIVSAYRRQFDSSPAMLVSAPGRVNLIGEHTDYNDGFVLPMAIDKQIVIGGTLREDAHVRVYSLNFEELAEFSLEMLVNTHSWGDYLKGVMCEFLNSGYALKGFDAVIGGNVPRGAGLSSSAAIEVATAFFLTQLHDISMPPEQMAKLCQRAENLFVGVNCGIMDQFISRLGQQDHALFLDCRDLSYQQIPFQLEGYTLVICNSNVERKLVDSAYNERRAQCEEGVGRLQIRIPHITALRDVSSAQLAEHADLLPPLVYQRCRHVITENERVMEAAQVLQSGNLERFGGLLNQSHDSLRDDYEVSCRELDILVEIARGIDGTLGARMTGAGFGGCMISLVSTADLKHFQTVLLTEYANRTGIQVDIYTSTAQDGARVESL
ncbi:MAG: galactokinase [Candidatus Vecturithrix sp.]|jgi:galactokinase|nr:galactokinase [Candidatus Vecturithrix sp.]